MAVGSFSWNRKVAPVVRKKYSAGASTRVGAGGTGPPPPAPLSGGAPGGGGGGGGASAPSAILALLAERDVRRARRRSAAVGSGLGEPGSHRAGLSLILRGLSVLCSFPEEVGLVFDPPF